MATAVLRSVLLSVALAAICSYGAVLANPTNLLLSTEAKRPVHPNFAKAGKTAGLEIWRIEDFEPVSTPTSDYGKFYSGDSYIVLNTQKLENDSLAYNVHFLLGSESSQDESSAAAIYTVNLDDSLDGKAVQHREVQNHESKLFLSYFKNGVQYQEGGVGTGFEHVETNPEGEKRLFLVKGKRNIRVRQVSASISSMNKGDSFVLDNGNTIYVYVGPTSSRAEKRKAISVATQLRDHDHHGRSTVEVADEHSTELYREIRNFFVVLGSGSPKEVPSETTAGDDYEFEKSDDKLVTLYKVSDQSGSLKVAPASTTKPLVQENLNTNECFVLETGSGVYTWVGRSATEQEKNQASAKAQELLKLNKYPAWAHVERVVEDAEPVPFTLYFAAWTY